MMCKGCGYDIEHCLCGADQSVVTPPKQTRKPFSDISSLPPLDRIRMSKKIRELIRHDQRPDSWKGIRYKELGLAARKICSERSEGYRALRSMEYAREAEQLAQEGRG